MSILFSCSCGKAMKAKEEFAGRKVKCPQCSNVVRIPQVDKHESRPTDPVLSKPVSHALRPAPTKPAAAAIHAWVDQSLTQRPTPWLPGDEARFQQGVKLPREALSGAAKGVLGIVVMGVAIAAGWLLTKVF